MMMMMMIRIINLAQQTCHIKTIGDTNKNSRIEFKIKLSYELWENFLTVIMVMMLIFYLIIFSPINFKYFIQASLLKNSIRKPIKSLG